MEFFSDKDPWTFESCKYPTWDDCMRFYKSRIVNKVPQKSIINQLAEAVETIWKTGDGCPKSKSSIRTQFENYVLPAYQKYRRGDTIPRVRKKILGTSAPSPARRSGRSQGSAPSISMEDISEEDQSTSCDTFSLPPPPEATTSQPLISKRKEGKERRESWLADHGHKLVDVFSEAAMVKVLEEGRCFDSDFMRIRRINP